MTTIQKQRGTCTVCERPNLVLTQIDSGDKLCQSCLKQIREKRSPAITAKLNKIKKSGIEISYHATDDEIDQTLRIVAIRQGGIEIAADASPEKISHCELLLEVMALGLPCSESDSMAALEKKKSEYAFGFETLVRGSKHKNEDGSSRSKLARQFCRPGRELILIPEPDNKHDPNAVKVCLADGRMLGYISAGVAASPNRHGMGCISEAIRNGRRVKAIVYDVQRNEEYNTYDLIIRLDFFPFARKRVDSTPAIAERQIKKSLFSRLLWMMMNRKE